MLGSLITNVQGATLIFSVAALVVFYLNVQRFPQAKRAERFWYILPIISYVIHCLVFYVVVIAINWGDPDPDPQDWLRIWSAILRFHGIASIFWKEVVAFKRSQWKKTIVTNGGFLREHE